MRIKVEKRFYITKWQEVCIILASIVLAFSSGALVFHFLGVDPLEAYKMMIDGSLGDFYGVSETVAKTYLIMCSLAVALSFTMVVWNIGAEGQFVLGALACTAFVRYLCRQLCGHVGLHGDIGLTGWGVVGSFCRFFKGPMERERDYYNVNDELCCHTFVAIFRLRFMARSYQLRLSHDASFP